MGASLGVCGGSGENIDAVDRIGHALQRHRCADALGGRSVTAMMFRIAGTPLAVGSLLLRLLLRLLLPLRRGLAAHAALPQVDAALRQRVTQLRHRRFHRRTHLAVSGGDVQLRLLIADELLPALVAALFNDEESNSILSAALPWLEIDAPHEMTFNLDGEPLKGRHFRIEVLPQAIECRLPPNCALLG